MTTDRQLLPIACTLTPGVGATQLAAWRAFNDDHHLGVVEDDGSITARYARGGDAISRLAALVETEKSCCGFATWAIETDRDELVLTVTGSDDALATLTFLRRS
jgi:hypothetical protein